MSVEQAARQLIEQLRPLYGTAEAQSITRIVFEDAFGLRTLRDTAPLPPAQEKELEGITRRLLNWEPVQYVLGQADFYGLKFRVDQRVLIPRQETEELVHWILEAHAAAPPLRLLDIGTGSGCIPITLKRLRPEWQVDALDVSADALALAQENAKRYDTEIKFHQLDIRQPGHWARLPDYGLIVSNPPYIPPSERKVVPPNVLRYEPQLALFTETEDALLFYRTIGELALQRLRPGGWLYFELNEFSAAEVPGLLRQQGFEEVVLREDLHGKPRMARGRQPAAG
jgi:release factor glutamine methyltransferase